MPQPLDQNVLDLRRLRGQALRAARSASGLSARKLVERVNARTGGSDITEHAIYAYESGRVQLSREVAERVADVLKVPLGGLLAGDPDFAPEPDEAASTAGPAGRVLQAPADPANAAAGASAAAVSPDGPPEPGRWAATRSSLLSRCGDADPAASVLVRQLSARRFQLPDPLIFAASFELLETDLAGLVNSPEASWLACRDGDRWHEPLHELLAAARELQAVGRRAWDDLRASAATGRAADACPAAVEALDAALGGFRDAAGRVRRLAAGA